MADENHGIEIGIDASGAKAGEDRVVRSLENIKKKTKEVGDAGAAAGKQTAEGLGKAAPAADGAAKKLDSIKAKAREAGEANQRAGKQSFDAWAQARTGIDRHLASLARGKPTLKDLEASMDRVSRSRPFENAQRSASGFFDKLTSLRNLLLAIGAIEGLRSIAQTEVQFRGFNQALRIVTGSQEQANKELAYAEQVANRLGFRIKDITGSYVQFSAAAKGTSLEGEGQRHVFESLTRAAAAYGLTNEQLKDSLLAVQQMIGKGTVSAEELRGQLGERLPGAVQIAARAMGVTTGVLFKMMEQGQLVSDVFLAKFADQLDKEIPQSARSANAAFNEFLSQLDKAKLILAESGIFEGLAAGAKALGDAFKQMSEDGTLRTVGEAIGGFFKILAENLELLKLAAIGIGVFYAALKLGAIMTVVAELIALERALGAATVASALFGAGTKGMMLALRAIPLGAAAAAVAIVALVAIYGRMQETWAAADQVLQGVDKSLADSVTTLQDAQNFGNKAADAAGSLGSQALGAVPGIDAFAGATGNAADQLYRMAHARRQAMIAELEEKRTKASIEYSDMYMETDAGLDARVRGDGSFRHGVFSLDGWAADGKRLGRSLGMVENPSAVLQDGMRKKKEEMANYDASIAALNAKPLETFVPPSAPSRTPTPSRTPGRRTPRSYETRQSWSSDDVKKLLEGGGARITSGLRTADQQRALIARWEKEDPRTRGIRPAAVGTSYHEKGQAFDIAKTPGMTMARIRALLKGVPIKELIDEGDHFHVAWGKAGDAVADANREMERQLELAKRRKEAEVDFWQTLDNEIGQAKILPENQEAYNKELELTQILNDGQVAGEKQITDEQRKRIADKIKERDTQQFITDLTVASADALREKGRLEKEAGIIASGTKDQIEDRLELERRMYDWESRALNEGLNLQDEVVKKAMEELRMREATNIELERKNRLISEGNDLVDRLLDSRDPKRRLDREYGENVTRIARSTRSPDEKRDALTILKENYAKDMEEINASFLQSMLSSVDRIADAFGGSFGEAIRGLGSLVSGFIAMGQPGYVAGGVAAQSNAPGARIASNLKDMTDLLGETFKGKTGSFFKGLSSTLGKLGDGAAMGANVAAVGQLIWKKFSSTGAQIGGAVGNAIFGPIGGLIGSVFGGIVGGLFKKSKSGAATVSGAGAGGTAQVGSAFGNSEQLRGQATGAGKGVVTGLNNIARALGGSVGAFGNITIGVKDDKWRVNTSGTNLDTKKGAKDFGKDGAEAAMAYAIQEAVRRGAIQGLSEATSRVIRGAGDNLENAVGVAQVYEELVRQSKLLADPINGAFDALNRGFKITIDQLKSVGYTNEEIAALQNVFADQQKKLLESMTEGYKNLIEIVTKGPDSGLTIYQQYLNALDAFNNLKSSGNYTQEQFTSAGQKLFDLARQAYGTATPEFEAIKAELVAATQDAIGRVETAASAASNSSAITDAVNAASAAAAAQRDETNQTLRDIREMLAMYGGGGGSAWNGYQQREAY